MKKLITLILGVLLICGLCTVAFAAPKYTTSVDGKNLVVIITDDEASYGEQITFQLLVKDKKIDLQDGRPLLADVSFSGSLYMHQQ